MKASKVGAPARAKGVQGIAYDVLHDLMVLVCAASRGALQR